MMQKNKRLFKIYVSIIILLLLIFALGALESLGLFPGSLLNRLSVNSYMKSTYPDLEYKHITSNYSREENVYIYDMERQGGAFTIKAKGLKVTYDGYFDQFLKDIDLIGEISDSINENLSTKGHMEYYYFDYPIKKGQYQSPDQALNELEGLYGLVLELTGESLTFEQYKALAAKYGKEAFDKDYLPAYFQIFYYRLEGDDKILQYESRIREDFLYYEEDLIERAADTHFLVELDEKMERKLKIYNFVRNFYMIFILVTALVLSYVWLRRKRVQYKGGE